MRGLKEIITEYAAKNGKISKESVAEILDITDLKRLVNEVAANIPLKYKASTGTSGRAGFLEQI